MLTAVFVIFYIVLFISAIVLILLLASFGSLFLVKVPFVPTPRRNFAAVVKLLAIKPGEIFYDLGAGDGRFIIAAATAGAKATGFEINLWAYLKAKFNIFKNHSSARIIWRNFYHTNLSNADIVFCFLIYRVMPKVSAKLRAELKPGARVVCYGFPLTDWVADQIVDPAPERANGSKIYIYQK